MGKYKVVGELLRILDLLDKQVFISSEDTYDKFSKYYDSYSDGNTDDFAYYSKLDFENKTVLDVGCGTGRLESLFIKLNSKELFCVDCSDKMLDICRTKIKNAHVLKHNFEENGRQIACCDIAVISFFTINYIKKLNYFLTNIIANIKKNGIIVIDAFIPDAINEPETNNVWYKFDPIVHKGKKIDIFDKREYNEFTRIEKRIQFFFNETDKTFDIIVTERRYYSPDELIEVLKANSIIDIEISYGYGYEREAKFINYFIKGKKTS